MNFPEPSFSVLGTGLQTEPQLISQDQYNAYTQLWRETVKGSPDLNPYFTEGGQRMLYAYYSAQTIVNLVSTPGIDKVKVRFGIVNDQFVAITFASDVDGIPVSAYFLALNATSTAQGEDEGNGGNQIVGDIVPQSLAESWMSNWANVSDVTQSLFAVDDEGIMDGFLRGYTFKAADFRETLFGSAVVTDRIVRVHFGLHQYYRAGSTSLASTFGLVLDSTGPSGDSGVFSDVSTPCPKTC